MQVQLIVRVFVILSIYVSMYLSIYTYTNMQVMVLQWYCSVNLKATFTCILSPLCLHPLTHIFTVIIQLIVCDRVVTRLASPTSTNLMTLIATSSTRIDFSHLPKEGPPQPYHRQLITQILHDLQCLFNKYCIVTSVTTLINNIGLGLHLTNRICSLNQGDNSVVLNIFFST